MLIIHNRTQQYATAFNNNTTTLLVFWFTWWSSYFVADIPMVCKCKNCLIVRRQSRSHGRNVWLRSRMLKYWVKISRFTRAAPHEDDDVAVSLGMRWDFVHLCVSHNRLRRRRRRRQRSLSTECEYAFVKKHKDLQLISYESVLVLL